MKFALIGSTGSKGYCLAKKHNTQIQAGAWNRTIRCINHHAKFVREEQNLAFPIPLFNS